LYSLGLSVLPLSSSEWSNLSDAYGQAEHVPALLRQLDSYPSSNGNSEPWFSLWSALCHQGDVYPASFAAVPHIVQALASAPERAGFDFFLLPAAVEVARVQKNVAVPAALEAAYFAALSRLPALAGSAVRGKPNQSLCQSALAAFAVGAGQSQLARLLMEVEHGDIAEVLKWYESR
jgi:hypothetical protein